MVGDRRQETARKVPGVEGAIKRMFYPVRGKIVNNGVSNKDSAHNKGDHTWITVELYDETHTQLQHVPILSSKINKDNGEEWTPESGDNVLVSFIDGNFYDPIVVGYLPPAGNSIQATAAESPRYYKKRNGTWEEWDKDGNRTIHVAADDKLTVVGDGTVDIGGALNITVVGDATIKAANATVEATAKATVKGADVDVIATATAKVTGADVNVTATGVATVVAPSVKLGSLTGLKSLLNDTFVSLFNTHTHPGDSGGTTGAPNQQAGAGHQTSIVKGV